MQKYSRLASLLKKAKETKSSLKSVILQNNSNDFDFARQAYSLLIKAVKKWDVLINIIEELDARDPFDCHDKYLLVILILEIFNPTNTKAKRIGGKISKYLKSHAVYIKETLEKNDVFQQDLIKQSINLRLIEEHELPFPHQVDQHIPDLIRLDYQDYSGLIKEDVGFLQQNWFIIQSKSSAMPPFLLLRDLLSQKKKYKFDIIDCCSAPGNKTMQLAHYMNQLQVKGKVFAIELDAKRFDILNKRVNRYGYADRIKTFNQDFFSFPFDDSRYKNIRMALLDPSCSGSGMSQQRMVSEDQTIQTSPPENRISSVESLARMQLQMLLHLRKFPNLKRIIYSTCSLYEMENERVADTFLRESPEWKAVDLFPQWETRGIERKNYIRFYPGQEGGDGFFIAMFKRK